MTELDGTWKGDEEKKSTFKRKAIFSYSESSDGQSDRFQPQGKDISDPSQTESAHLHLGIKWQSTDVKELENLWNPARRLKSTHLITQTLCDILLDKCFVETFIFAPFDFSHWDIYLIVPLCCW